MDVLHLGPAELIRTLTGRESAGQGTRMVNLSVIGGGGRSWRLPTRALVFEGAK